jgi:hypothetical protein
MRIRKSVASATMAAIFWTSPVFARSQHIADPAALEQALTAQQQTDAANRDLIIRVLHRDDARVLAARMGLDVETATVALSHLTSQQLAELAATARAVDTANLAGGSTTIVISLTTLLLIIIVVLLIAK